MFAGAAKCVRSPYRRPTIAFAEGSGWQGAPVSVRANDGEEGAAATRHVVAANCYAAGRIDDALSYGDSARLAIESGSFDAVPYDLETAIGGGASIMGGHAERWIELCRNVIERDTGTHTYARSSLALALTLCGDIDEALAASQGLLASADATDNPQLRSYTLAAYGIAHRDADPISAIDVQRRGLAVAQNSGNRQIEHILAVNLARLASTHGHDPMEAFDFLTLAICARYDSGSFSLLPPPLAILFTFLDRLGHYEAAADYQWIRYSAPHTCVLSRGEHRDHSSPRGARQRGLRIPGSHR